MNRDIVRQWVNLLTFAITIAVNSLSETLPLNGQTTGAISDRFFVFFVPAGYVFSIWGIIYLALLAFTIYQALPSQRANPHLRHIGYLFALSGLANSVWIVLWHYNLWALTVLVMLALLALLIAIYLRLGIGRAQASRAEQWLMHVPFSIYLGWITVATVANITDLLYSLNWNGWGISSEVWAVIMLIVATAVTMAVLLTRRDVAYGLVIVWAFAGIAVKQAATLMVALPAGLLAAIVALALLWTIYGARRPATA